MKIFIAAAAIFVAVTPLGAQTGARQALQTLERHAGEEVIGKMVAIVGFNGASQPEAWQILTLAPKNDAVLHEFIVRGKTVTGPKTIARQEGQDLPKLPVLLASMKLDSTDLYHLADDQAIEAGASFAKLNYQLRWRGNDPEPTWRATLLSANNQVVGQIYVMAASGTVMHREFGPQAAQAAHAKTAE